MLLLLPDGAVKESTARRLRPLRRRRGLRRAARARARRSPRDATAATDLAALPPNDLASLAARRRARRRGRLPSRRQRRRPDGLRPLRRPRRRRARRGRSSPISAASGSPILPGSLSLDGDSRGAEYGSGRLPRRAPDPHLPRDRGRRGPARGRERDPRVGGLRRRRRRRRLLVDVGPPRQLADGAPGELDPRRLADLPRARAAVLHLLQDGRVRRARDPRDRRARSSSSPSASTTPSPRPASPAPAASRRRDASPRGSGRRS